MLSPTAWEFPLLSVTVLPSKPFAAVTVTYWFCMNGLLTVMVT